MKPRLLERICHNDTVRKTLLRCAASCLLLSPLAAVAYYDDVHYALTYYIARRSGLTVEQSFRLASACSSVDYDEHTEPVQPHGQVALLADRGQGLVDLAEWGIRKIPELAARGAMNAAAPTGLILQKVIVNQTSISDLREAASYARFRYHAFRDELEWDDPVGKGAPDGSTAENDVRDELKELYQDALSHKNLGTFLHAFQDFEPHRYYGTTWGHNPFSPDHFQKHLHRGLLVGSTTDWISHRPNDVENLIVSVNGRINAFIKSVSPHQHTNGYNPSDYTGLVAQLARQRAPAPIAKDIQRQLFIRAFARSKGVNLDAIDHSFIDFVQLQTIASDLGVGLSAQDIEKHLKGPDTAQAVQTINAFLKSKGMRDQLPFHHYQYDLDDEGFPEEGWEDNWVMTGDLSLTTRGTGDPVTVTLKQRIYDPALKKEKDVPLKLIPPFRLAKGETKDLTNLPIGSIILEIRRADKSTVIERTRLLQRRNTASILLKPAGKPASTPSKPPAPTKPVAANQEENVDFSGTWQTTQGRFAFGPVIVKLSQSGTSVTGTYTIPDGKSGTLSGTVKGRVFSYTYQWEKTQGKGSFTMSKDGQSIEGTYDGGNRWGGPRKKEQTTVSRALRTDAPLPPSQQISGIADLMALIQRAR